VGPCKAGTQTCNAQGTAYSACTGEVVPAAEACGDLVDNDCDGAVNEAGVGCVCVPGATASCYSGPGGTEGVGQCKAGMKTCNAEGTAFGPCAGEVVPAAESCQTLEDENCSGPMLEGCGEHVWSKLFGDAQAQTGRGIAVDAAGNVLLTGEIAGTADFGGGPLTSAGNDDIFVAKLSAAGDHIWSKRFGNNSNRQGGTDIAVDAAGNVLFTGALSGAIDFGGGPLQSAGSDDIFIAKLSPAGDHVWSKAFGTPAMFESGRMVDVDAAGNVVLGAYIDGPVDFGGGSISTPGLVVVKFDADGNHLWSKAIPMNNSPYEDEVVVDSAGNVFITGQFSATIDHGGGPVTSMGSTDVFVTKLSPGGNHIFTKRFGSASGEGALSMVVDAAGNMLLTGYLYGSGVVGSIDFGGGPLTGGVNNLDVFLVKLDAAGGHIFSKLFGGMEPELSERVAVDDAGNVFLAGIFDGTIDFGLGPMTAMGTGSIYLAKWSPSGTPLWSKHYDSGFSAIAFPVVALATDSAGHLLLTGNFNGTADFGDGPKTSAGSLDILALKLAP
jgi:hypothetical protein